MDKFVKTFTLLLLPCWLMAQQQYKPIKPVQLPQATMYKDTATGIYSMFNGATYQYFAFDKSSTAYFNQVLNGLNMSVVDSTLTVSTGRWIISNKVYSLSAPVNFTLRPRDSVYSRYETVYADSVNNGIHIAIGTLSPFPIEPSIPQGDLRVGAVLITPTVTIVIPPGTITNYIQSNPTVKQNAYYNVRKGMMDTIVVNGAYTLPSQPGLSGQSIFYGGGLSTYWAYPNVNGVITATGLYLNSNNAGIDTTFIATAKSIRDSLLAHTAIFNPTQFTISNDTISLIGGGGGSVVTGQGLSGTGTSLDPIVLGGNVDGTSGIVNIQLNNPTGTSTSQFHIQDANTSAGLHIVGNGTEIESSLIGSANDFSSSSAFNAVGGTISMRSTTTDDQSLTATGGADGFILIDAAHHAGISGSELFTITGNPNQFVQFGNLPTPVSTNIYNSNGTFTGNRTGQLVGNNLIFNNVLSSDSAYFEVAKNFITGWSINNSAHNYGTYNISQTIATMSVGSNVSSPKNAFFKAQNNSGTYFAQMGVTTATGQSEYLDFGNNAYILQKDAINHSTIHADSLSVYAKLSSASQWGYLIRKQADSLYAAAGSSGITALTGDVTASGPGSAAATLATVATGATTGSSTAIPVVTFNNKGLVTGITTAAVVAPAGTVTGTTLASNVVTSSLTSFGNSPTLVTPILGTPTSVTLTNATGLPVSTGISGLGTGIATFLTTPSSANLAAALTDETGTGVAVFGTAPTFTTSIIDPLVVGSITANGTLTLTGNNASSGNTAANRNIVFKTGNSSGAEAGYFTNNSNLVLNGLLSFGTGAGSGSGIYIYDGGASTRIGMGQPSGGSFQNFQITGGFFSWNYGGGLQTAGTNEVMRAMTNGSFGLLIGGTTDDGVNKLQVSGGIKSSGQTLGFSAKTTTYTATASDQVISGDGTSAAFTITLPTAASVSGRTYTIKKIDASVNAVTVGTTSSQTIDGSTTYALSLQYKYVTVVSNGTNWLIVSNN